jgi:hypothetical protein
MSEKLSGKNKRRRIVSADEITMEQRMCLDSFVATFVSKRAGGPVAPNTIPERHKKLAWADFLVRGWTPPLLALRRANARRPPAPPPHPFAFPPVQDQFDLERQRAYPGWDTLDDNLVFAYLHEPDRELCGETCTYVAQSIRSAPRTCGARSLPLRCC